MDIKLVLCLANKVDLKANFREKEEDVRIYKGLKRNHLIRICIKIFVIFLGSKRLRDINNNNLILRK